MIIAQQRGRGLQPGNFAAASAVARAVKDYGSDVQAGEILESFASGETSLAWALDGNWLGTGDGGITSVRHGEGYVLSGTSPMVQDADEASWLLVTSVSDGDVRHFLMPAHTPGLRIEPLESIDISR